MDRRVPSAEELSNMTPTQCKVLESRLRRAATHQGLRLEKSRTRDTSALDYCGYWLVKGPKYEHDGDNWRSREQVVGGDYGVGLDDVAVALWG